MVLILLKGELKYITTTKWGTVCSDDFDESDANVIYQMLGYDTQ